MHNFLFAFLGVHLLLSSGGLQAQKKPSYDTALQYRKERNLGASVAEFKALLEKDPKDAEVWHQLGITQRFQGNFESAFASQSKSLVLDPAKVEAKIELARLYYRRQEYEETKRLIGEILADKSDPQALDFAKEKWVIKLLSNKEAEAAGSEEEAEVPFHWQIDTGYERSNFSRRPRPFWQQYFVQVGYVLTRNTRFHVRGDLVKRGNVRNEHYEGGFSHRFSVPIILDGSIGHTPDSVFIPKWRFKGELQGEAWKKLGFIGPVWLSLHGQHDRYRSINISVFKPGLSYTIIDPVTLKAQYVHVIDENKKTLRGWILRADWRTFLEGLRLFGGISNTPETEERVTVRTKSKFAGFSWQFHPQFFLHGSYAREDREKSYIRHVFSLSASVRL